MRYVGLLSVLLLGACSLVPEYARPTLEFADQWDPPSPAPENLATANPSAWWEGFRSTTLTQLITQALANNNDLAAALARVAQARAEAGIAGAPLFPQVDATASDTRTLAQNRNGSKNHSARAGVGVAYELDLLGGNRARAEAAAFSLEATQFDRDALALVVAADVASHYFALLTLTEQQRIAEANLKNGREVLEILQARFDAGRVSGLELAQQKTSLATSEAALTSLQQSADAYRHALAVLVGVAPQQFSPMLDDFSALAVPQVPPSLPSTLLTQRPDIRAAEAQLRAANADIGAARAAFFPSLSLGLDGLLVKGTGTALDLSANLLAPIFHGGALEGQLEVSAARKEELAAQYRATVLTAFQEASDALANVQHTQTRHAALAEATTHAQQAYDVARARYLGGAVDYQVLLDTERSLLASTDAKAQAQRDQWQAAADLSKALGGSADMHE